jgi:hypothetical protein
VLTASVSIRLPYSPPSATIALATVAHPKQQKAKEDKSSFAEAAEDKGSLTYWQEN